MGWQVNPTAAQTPIFYDQHAGFWGTTGSGKTFHALKELRYRMLRLAQGHVANTNYKVVHIDTKRAGRGFSEETGYFINELKAYHGTIVHDWRDFRLNAPNDPIYHVYRPDRSLQTPDDFNLFFNYLLGLEIKFQGNTIQLPMLIIIDEYTDIFGGATTRTQYMPNFTKILSQGRATMQTVWIESQKTAFVDADIKANVGARFVFRLPNPDDRKRIADMTGDSRVKKPIRFTHGMFYQNDMLEWAMEPIFFNGRQ